MNNPGEDLWTNNQKLELLMMEFATFEKLSNIMGKGSLNLDNVSIHKIYSLGYDEFKKWSQKY